MSSDLESTMPLLGAGPSSTRDLMSTVTSPVTSSTQTSPRPKHSRLSFYEEYKVINGVPTRSLSPTSSLDVFKCHAFSSDGSRLATGESNGTIRLWSTENYTLIDCATQIFSKSVECLRFFEEANDTLIAVDSKGRVLKFQFRSVRWDESVVAGATTSREDRTRIQQETTLDFASAHNRKIHVATRQISENGHVLLTGSWEPNHPFILHDFSQDTVRSIQLGADSDGEYTMFPILSENGKSILACYARTNAFGNPNARRPHSLGFFVRVWPRIDFANAPTHSVFLSGDKAKWGMKGAYVLLWNPFEERPMLSVYRSEDLDKDQSSQPMLPPKKLDAGLADWNAEMIDPTSVEDPIRVLICETSHTWKKKFSIWDLDRNRMTHEVIVPIANCRSIDKSLWSMYGKTAETLIETGEPPKSLEAYFCRLKEDLYPKYTISKNGSWIGVFSWSQHCAAIASIITAVPVWDFTVPEGTSIDPFDLPCQVTFDPRGENFLLICNRAIFACTPAFLSYSEKSTPCRELETSVNNLFIFRNNPHRETLLEIFKSLSSEAFAEIAAVAKDDGFLDLIFPVKMPKNPRAKYITDAVVSSDGHQLGVIIYGGAGELSVLAMDIRDFLSNGYLTADPALTIVPLDIERFTPGRLFFFQDGLSKQSLVLFSAGFKPVAVFCNLNTREIEKVEFDMDRCHKVSQTEDRRRLALLDVNGVCIADLTLRTIIDRIPYKCKFSQLVKLIRPARKWLHKGSNYRDKNFECRISDDGRRVLLAWDAKNDKAIAVTPTMKHEECVQCVEAAGQMISDFCQISKNGQCVTFVDVNDLNNDRITIGVFNNTVQRVTHRICIAEQMPFHGMPFSNVLEVMSSVFYGISTDGTELVTAFTKRSMQMASLTETKAIRRFTIYAAEDCIPEYDRLISTMTNTDRSVVERLVEKHGVFALNTPFSDGMSNFQKAALFRNHLLQRFMLEVASEHNLQLTTEWHVPVSKTYTHLLHQSLHSHDTNSMRDFIELTSSRSTPYGRGARLLRNCMKEISIEHWEIVKDALVRNLFVHRACELIVHVNFMSDETQRDSAIHIGTSDTFLEWEHGEEIETRSANWRANNEETIHWMERKGNRSTTRAMLQFVCIEDAAKTGMRGIIRPLLLQNAPEFIFRFDPVKWVVLFKWFKIWRRRFVHSIVKYIIFLIAFTIYACLMEKFHYLGDDASSWNRITASLVLLIVWCFALDMIYEEMKQVQTFRKDGRQYLKSSTHGLKYFLRSGWNWVDLLSCLLMLICIPVFHVLLCLECTDVQHRLKETLTVFIATTAILCYMKVWYYAQPFRRTGALVLLINNVLNDCVYFLILALVILIGFSVALFVLFGVAREEMSSAAQEVANESFSTLFKSVISLFYALLGAFDPELFWSTGRLKYFITLVFVIYTFAQTILLLNLVISLMGDTFDRVKTTEEDQMLMGRAMFVDACEASLSEAECEQIDESIGKYIHAIVPIEDDATRVASMEWTGKMNMIEERFRSRMLTTEERMRRLVESGESNVQRHVTAAIHELERHLTTSMASELQRSDSGAERISTRMEELSSMIQQSDTQITQLEEKLNAMNANMTEQMSKLLSLLEREDTGE